MELTLAHIDHILRKPFVVDKGLHHKYRLAIGKLKEVRAFLLGESSHKPDDPFLPLTQLPREYLD